MGIFYNLLGSTITASLPWSLTKRAILSGMTMLLTILITIALLLFLRGIVVFCISTMLREMCWLKAEGGLKTYN